MVNPSYKPGAILMRITNTTLRDLYHSMLRIRYCEESLVKPIESGEVRCPVHLCTGQEAVSAGVCAALKQDDYIFGNHRSHGHYLAKGGGMKEMVAEIYGKETGCSRAAVGQCTYRSAGGHAGSAPPLPGPSRSHSAPPRFVNPKDKR